MWSSLGKYIQKPEWVFLALASVFGVFSAVLVPQLSIPDENMHFLRSYSIASGHLVGNHNKCTYPNEVYDRAYSIYKGDYQAHYAKKVNLNDLKKPIWCGTASSYSPLVYIPQVIGIAAAKLIHPSTGLMILFGRLASIACYAGALYYIIKRVRIGKWAFVVIALFPTAIQQAASLSADGITYLAFFATVALLLNLAAQKTLLTRRQAILLALLSAALALSKVPDALLLLMIPFLPSRLFNFRPHASSRLLKAWVIKWYVFLAAVLFAAICAMVWQKIYGQPLVAAAANNPIPHHPWKFIPILFHTYVYMDPKTALFNFAGLGGFGDFILSSIVGGFASYRYWLPEIFIFMGYALLLLTLLRPNTDEDKLLAGSTGKLALGGLLSLGALVVAISYSLYVMWALPLLGPPATYAAGLQGRYFTATLVVLIPAGMWLRRYVSVVVKTDVLFSSIIATTSGFLLSFYTLQTLYAIHLGMFH